MTTLIRNFSFPLIVTDMTRISSDRSLLDDYMADRVSRELASWDVYVPGPVSGVRTDDGMFLGSRSLNLRLRGKGKVHRGAFRIYGSRNRVADPADATFGLSVEQKTSGEKTCNRAKHQG